MYAFVCLCACAFMFMSAPCLFNIHVSSLSMLYFGFVHVPCWPRILNEDGRISSVYVMKVVFEFQYGSQPFMTWTEVIHLRETLSVSQIT